MFVNELYDLNLLRIICDNLFNIHVLVAHFADFEENIFF